MLHVVHLTFIIYDLSVTLGLVCMTAKRGGARRGGWVAGEQLLLHPPTH